MSSIAPTFGVPGVAFSYIDTVTTPSLSAATIAYSIVTPNANTYRKNSTMPKLSGTYKVIVALMGLDDVNRGYGIAESSALSATQTVAAGQGILVNIATLPANMAGAVVATIWLQKGSADPKMAAFGFIDPGTQFSCLLMNEPWATAPSAPTAVLIDDAQTNRLLLNRTPKNATYGDYLETTRGVSFNKKTTKIQVAPDSGADYTVTTVRSTDLAFAVMSNDLGSLAQVEAGDTWTFIDSDSTVVDQSQFDLVAIANTIQGNMPLKVVMPPDDRGTVIYELHLGNVQVNTSDFSIKMLKNEPFAIDVLQEAAPLDALTRSMMNGIRWGRRP